MGLNCHGLLVFDSSTDCSDSRIDSGQSLDAKDSIGLESQIGKGQKTQLDSSV